MERRIDIPESDAGFQRFWKGNCNAGQLTDTGRAQAKALGQSLRALYLNSATSDGQENKDGIWGSVGIPTEENVFVRSTDVWYDASIYYIV
jgi:hypothetical protein